MKILKTYTQLFETDNNIKMDLKVNKMIQTYDNKLVYDIEDIEVFFDFIDRDTLIIDNKSYFFSFYNIEEIPNDTLIHLFIGEDNILQSYFNDDKNYQDYLYDATYDDFKKLSQYLPDVSLFDIWYQETKDEELIDNDDIIHHYHEILGTDGKVDKKLFDDYYDNYFLLNNYYRYLLTTKQITIDIENEWNEYKKNKLKKKYKV